MHVPQLFKPAAVRFISPPLRLTEYTDPKAVRDKKEETKKDEVWMIITFCSLLYCIDNIH